MVIVDCNPGFKCVTESDASLIDCLLVASTDEEKVDWNCSGEGRFQCWSPTQQPVQTPDGKPIPEKYLDFKYCEEDSDCVIFHEICGEEVINKYYFNETKDKENLVGTLKAFCAYYDRLENPHCENNICVADVKNE